ncbi:MAG: hypothetical protein PHY47_01170 [Lachnospiraceae bacterium]|nr:hypothetical protein [Lachnospiraceae bacterium]
MTSRDFCYWLQCSFELMKAKAFDEEQTEIIRRHLAMVFIHEIDPSMGNKEHQGKLNSIHSGMNSSSNMSNPYGAEEVESNTLSSPLTHSPLHTTVNWKKHLTKEGYLVRC